MLRQNPRQRRQCFLGPILMIACEKHDVLANPRTALAFVNDVLPLGRCRHRHEQ